MNHLVQVVDNKNEDSIWVKIKKENFDGENDLYIGTYYISPDNSKERNKKNYDFFSAINEEVTYFSKKVWCSYKVISIAEQEWIRISLNMKKLMRT